jgi:hypothetical protein
VRAGRPPGESGLRIDPDESFRVRRRNDGTVLGQQARSQIHILGLCRGLIGQDENDCKQETELDQSLGRSLSHLGLSCFGEAVHDTPIELRVMLFFTQVG